MPSPAPEQDGRGGRALLFEEDVRDVLGIPSEVTQAALLAVAFFTGADFLPAARRPAREVTHREA